MIWTVIAALLYLVVLAIMIRMVVELGRSRRAYHEAIGQIDATMSKAFKDLDAQISLSKAAVDDYMKHA